MTHYSSTQIPNCQTQNNCYNKVNEIIKTDETLPKQLINHINYYKNYVGSAIYYFNESKKDVEKINSFCSDFIDPKVVFNINDYFFNIRNIFFYLDNTGLKSIELLTAYAAYLQKQEVDLITEEEIFLDFVLINENLNELKTEKINKNNYIGSLKESTKEANDLAQNFGFSENYLAKKNFTDLFSYYLAINEEINPEKEIDTPIFSNSVGFVVYRIANYENLKRINAKLINTDTYNLYLFLDKTLGFEKSSFIEFSELNNRIIKNIANTKEKIKNLEKEIENDKEHLDGEKLNSYFILKEKYRNEQIGFGRYLKELKDLKIEIEENKEITKINNLQKAQTILNCDLAIEKINTQNQYLLETIKKYKNEQNYLLKIELCEDIKRNYQIDDCVNKIRKIEEHGIITGFDLTEIDETKCKEIIYNLNRFLENNEKIILYNEIIKKILLQIIEINKFELDSTTELKTINYKEEIEVEKNKSNVEKIINIDVKISNCEKISTELDSVLNEEIKKDVYDKIKIEFIDNYYLNYYNKTIFVFEKICVTNKHSKISPKTDLLSIRENEVCLEKIYPGANYYKIEYNNNKTTITNIIELTIDKSLLETVVENDVVGIIDSLNLGQMDPIDLEKYYFDGELIHYTTEEKNKILYYKKIFEYTKNISITEVLENLLIFKETWHIKNSSEFDTNQPIKMFKKIIDEEITIKENDRPVDFFIDGDWVFISSQFLKNQEKSISINRLITTTSAKNIAEKIISDIYLLRNSQFLDISTDAKNIASEIDLEKITDINITNLEKIINKKELVEKLVEKENTFAIILTRYHQLKRDFENNLLDQGLINQLNQIDLDKYKDPQKTLENLEKIIADFEKKTESDKNQKFEENNKNINDIKEKLSELGLLTPETISEINGFDLFTDISKEINVFNTKINKEQEKIANKNQETLLEFDKEINNYDLYELIEQARLLFEDISLTQLYDVNIIPPFTLQDIERFEKKLKFKDTISFGKETDSFIDAFNDENYELANKRLTTSTVKKINEILLEKTIFVNGIEKIKKDAKAEYEKNKDKLSTTEIEEISLLLDQERYLLAHYLLKIKKTANPVKFEKTTQITVVLIILLLFYLAYLYYNKKTPKITKEEKKRRIIRKY